MGKQVTLVWQLSESDDFDGVARIGMAAFAKGAFHGVLEVLVKRPGQGWWLGEYDPYLVFYNGAAPAAPEETVNEFIRTAQVNTQDAPPLYTPASAGRGVCQEPVPSDWDFAWLANSGLRHAEHYQFVGLLGSTDDSPVLIYYNDQRDLPHDTEEPVDLPW